MAKSSKAKKPTHFNVFGAQIDITYTKGFIHKTGHLAEYDANAKTIEVDADLTGRALKLALTHELGHAIWDRVALNQTSIPSDLQEIIVENFSIGFDENGF